MLVSEWVNAAVLRSEDRNEGKLPRVPLRFVGGASNHMEIEGLFLDIEITVKRTGQSVRCFASLFSILSLRWLHCITQMK